MTSLDVTFGVPEFLINHRIRNRMYGGMRGQINKS